MQIIFKPQQLAYPQGLAIAIKGFQGDIGHKVTSQVFIEVYEGRLRVHVWNGSEDPVSTTNIDRKGRTKPE